MGLGPGQGTAGGSGGSWGSAGGLAIETSCGPRSQLLKGGARAP